MHVNRGIDHTRLLLRPLMWIGGSSEVFRDGVARLPVATQELWRRLVCIVGIRRVGMRGIRRVATRERHVDSPTVRNIYSSHSDYYHLLMVRCSRRASHPLIQSNDPPGGLINSPALLL